MKINALAEGAMLCALAVVLSVLSYYIPFMTLLFFFIPVPMIIVCLRQSVKTALLAGTAATILLFLFIDPVSALFSGVYILLTGTVLGICYCHKKSDAVKIGAAWLCVLLTLALMLGVISFISGQNVVLSLSQELEAVVKGVLDVYQSAGIFNNDQLAEMDTMLNQMVTTVKMMLPAAFLITPFIIGWLNLLITDTILKRLKLIDQKIRPLKDWHMSRSFRNFLMIGIIILFILSFVDTDQRLSNYTYTLITLLYAVFFIMGLSFIFWFMNFQWQKEKIGFKILIVVICFIIPIAVQFVQLLGMVDVFLNVRRLIVLKKGEK